MREKTGEGDTGLTHTGEAAGPRSPQRPHGDRCGPPRLAAPISRRYAWEAWWKPAQGRLSCAPWEDGRRREAGPEPTGPLLEL